MDRLESFFIRTVQNAQKQAQATSGAVSTTKISDFLEKETRVESILDKLVTSSVSQEPPSKEVETEKVQAAETSEPEPDMELLTELTDSNVTSQIEKTSEEEEAQTEEVEAQESQPVEEINRDILNSLVGRSESENSKNKQEEDEDSQTGGERDE